ncbi:hypothetical protein AGDE_14569 [Angomonas deanei]|uniref:Uncharacterized protein n=1 Tax=Angomonas deanei TaxID=59799 RepID=A0A7G2BZ72_9TRYP|nr:hypothetical protein AGDE_14569 [Angomonas deanei]CAD2212808.1 hypothetical protein, conserved [Angomonas deanei]|eukprot:EPY20625.1 hypothetical protein AGDE_14569 [Angomonas deanei]
MNNNDHNNGKFGGNETNNAPSSIKAKIEAFNSGVVPNAVDSNENDANRNNGAPSLVQSRINALNNGNGGEVRNANRYSYSEEYHNNSRMNSAGPTRDRNQTSASNNKPTFHEDVPSRGKSPEELKAMGNDAFEREEFALSIQLYTAAIEILCRQQQQQQQQVSGAVNYLLAILYSNRSAAYLQKAVYLSVEMQLELSNENGGANASNEAMTAECDQLYDRALYDAERAIALRPDWFKGYARQGDVQFILQRYPQAAESYEMALQLEPRNRSLQQSLEESREAARATALERVRQTSRRNREENGQRDYSNDAVRPSGLNDSGPQGEDRIEPIPEDDSRAHRQFNSNNISHISHESEPSPRGAAYHTYNGVHNHNNSNIPPAGYSTFSQEANRHYTEESASAPHPSERETTPPNRSVPPPPSGESYRLHQLEEYRRKKGISGTDTSTFPDSYTAGDVSEHTPVAMRQQTYSEENTTRSSPPRSTAREEEKVSPPPTKAAPDMFLKMLSQQQWDGNAGKQKRQTTTPQTSVLHEKEERRTVSLDQEVNTSTGPGSQRRLSDLKKRPYEYSSAAASAYQNKLLEEYRQRKYGK